MNISIFNLGFRPFFLFASIHALISLFIWTLIYSGKLGYSSNYLSPTLWHAHEMVYGYALAVVAGFLLTAARNWTGVDTLHGFPLAGLLLCWMIARIFGFVPGDNYLIWQAFFDNLFLFILAISLAFPIIKARHWKSLGIVGKVILILISNIVFYLGANGVIEEGERMGLYSGLYLVLALMLTLARRVLPFFIERGVGYAVELKNNVLIDRSSLILFLVFWIAEITEPDGPIALSLAAILFVLHSIRLNGWYTHGIWKHPLLWSLFLAYAFLILGFFLKTLSGFTDISSSLATHSFTYGGIGLMSLGMMARVSLGHTGRNVYEPSKALYYMFLFMLTGAIIRVIFPLFNTANYMLWIKWSYIHWLIAFLIFIFIYAPKLIMPRIDGKPG